MPGSRFQQLAEEAKKHIREISSVEAKQKLDRGQGAQLIDVREADEWAKGHAAGALHLSKGVLERDIEKAVPDVQTDLILYCGGGSRSALAAENLGRMGYNNVWSLVGGFKGWREAGLPVE